MLGLGFAKEYAQNTIILRSVFESGRLAGHDACDAYLMDASERLTALIEDQNRLLFLIRQTRRHSETSQLDQTATATESHSEQKGDQSFSSHEGNRKPQPLRPVPPG